MTILRQGRISGSHRRSEDVSRIVLLGVLALLLLHSGSFAGRTLLRHASEGETESKACVVWGPAPETNLRAEVTPDRPAWGEEWWLHADYERSWQGHYHPNVAAALEFVNHDYPLIRLKAMQYNFLWERPCSLALIGHVWADRDADGLPDWNDPGHWQAEKDFYLCDFPTRVDWRYDFEEPYPEFGLGEHFWVGWQIEDRWNGEYSGWNWTGDPTGEPYWSWWWDTYDWVRIFQAYGFTGNYTMEVLVEPIGALGLVTGGGWIPGGTSGSATRRTFGFNAQSQTGPTVAQLQFTDHGNKLKVHSDTVKALVIHEGDTMADFSGDCRVCEHSSQLVLYAFECKVMDRGEPGRGLDWFSLDVYDGDGNLYYSAGDYLGGGNIQIHRPDSGSVKGGAEPDAEAGDDASPPQAGDVLTMGHAPPDNSPSAVTDRATITFHLPSSGFATLEIYDITGRLVATPIDRHLNAGPHTATWNTDGAASGIYFYRLTAGESSAVGKVLLLR